jgi:hypothetical protein
LTDGFDLPFLCADITPRSLRVPGGLATEHSNGALGILAVRVRVPDLDAATRRYSALLGFAPGPAGNDFTVGSAHIALEASYAPNGDSGPISVALSAQPGLERGPLELRAGARRRDRARRLSVGASLRRQALQSRRKIFRRYIHRRMHHRIKSTAARSIMGV